MFTLLLLSLGVLGSVSSTLEEAFDTPDYYESHHTKVFTQWKNHFGKKYESILDEAYRFTVFVENWLYIKKVNEKGLSYTLGLNQFADLTGDEFRRYVHGKDGSCARPSAKRNTTRKVVKKRGDPPASVDWSTKGVVTPVKNQGQCGSCWAFSATGSMESATAIATGKLVSLSEQQLVDCSRNYGNYGCNGGWMDKAFQYVMSEGGLCSEQEYPYTAQDGVCKASSCGTKFDPVRSYQDVAHDSEPALVNALISRPVSILIEADQSSFQFYHSGVLTGNCGTRLDHGVLAVGYGNENGQDYWKVKNSWGATWGERGYVKICRNCNANSGQGECGILLGPSYPIV